MRFAVAVVLAALAQLLFFVRYASTGESGASYFGFLYIVLATLGAGWFAGRRSAVAGALSVVVAAAVDALLVLSGPAGVGTVPVDAALSVVRFVIAFWPYIAIGAIAGAIGGSFRRRVVGAR